MRKRLPPYGRRLEERLRRGDPPFLVVVTCAEGCWEQAQVWAASPNDNVGLPYPGDYPPQWYEWPVKDCLCIVSHGRGQDDQVINDLTTELLKAGALSVAVYDYRFATTRAIYPRRALADAAA